MSSKKTTKTSRRMKLSPAMWKALDDFAQAGGHGYGEYSYLGYATAKALQRRGLVRLGSRTIASAKRRMAWGWATEEGNRLLREHQKTRLAAAESGALLGRPGDHPPKDPRCD